MRPPKVFPPVNWLETIENIRSVRQKYPAPVDTMGCAQIDNQKDINQRFQVLVSLMLSSQTKDPITWSAVQRLKQVNLCNPEALAEAKEKDIEDLIHPVGFYRRKAVYLKKVAQILRQEYGGDIPNSVEDLCKLPGVGPKMAHLCMVEAWNVVTGIGVDTHVHRISERLGWVPSKGIKTPEDTRKALESWLPRDQWRQINLLLVGFGQTICTPVRPKCSECYNNVICPSSSVTAPAPSAKSSNSKASSSSGTNIKEEKVEKKNKNKRAKKEMIGKEGEGKEEEEECELKNSEEPKKEEQKKKGRGRPRKKIKEEKEEREGLV